MSTSPQPISPRKKRPSSPLPPSSPNEPKKLRTAPDSDLDDLMRLYKMAKETLSYCEGRLRTLSSRTHKSQPTIGGIPRKFLDLSHFPLKRFKENFHVIDCDDRPSGSKRPAHRVHISHALPHVNGTYIQDGTHNSAPLFVRAGPPRKFMGLDCRVALRREEKAWMIGLVPASDVGHCRIIGYYCAGVVVEGGWEAPAEGWRVVQEGRRGRVCRLKISYED